MKIPIVVGVLGCGYWGPNLVRNFKDLQSCTLKAMYDTTEDLWRPAMFAQPHIGQTHAVQKTGSSSGASLAVCEASARV